jgi:SagB-type dehydrogenase family enzyme
MPLSETDIKLNPYKKSLNTDIIKSFELRHSSRDLDYDSVIDTDIISTVLWAGHGINRPDGKRTTPLANGKQCMDLYVISDNAVHLYLAESHSLKYIKSGSFKKKIGKQGHTENSPILIIITSDLSKLPFIYKKEEKIKYSYANSGFIGQNIYLAANSLGLETCYAVYIDFENITEILELDSKTIPLNVMTLAYPKK